MEFKVGCITKFYRNNLVVVNEYFFSFILWIGK